MDAIVFNDMSADEVADLLLAMPAETRLRFVETLSERFCLACGEHFCTEGVCYCTRDD